MTAKKEVENLLPVELLITVAYDDRADEWTLDIGDVDHFEAWGVLMGCLEELEERKPAIRVRASGQEIDDDEEEEDD